MNEFEAVRILKLAVYWSSTKYDQNLYTICPLIDFHIYQSPEIFSRVES